MRRQISVWGCLLHLQRGSGVVWRPQAKIRQKRVIKVWIFRTFRRSCILCKWGARQVAGFCKEPRRSATEFYRCFQRTGRPPKQQICCSLVYLAFCFFKNGLFLPCPVKEMGCKPGISRRSLCMVSLYFAQCAPPGKDRYHASYREANQINHRGNQRAAVEADQAQFSGLPASALILTVGTATLLYRPWAVCPSVPDRSA